MNIPDMKDPQSYLGISAQYIGSANGYARFIRLGTQDQYIGVLQSDIEGNQTLTEHITFEEVRIPNSSRLALSVYPELPPPITPPNITTVGPEPIRKGGAPPEPVRKGYLLTDGTPLTPIRQNGQIVGLSGTTADGHTYELETYIGVLPPKLVYEPHWLVAQLRITKDSGDPFCFGFSFCGEELIGGVGAYLTDAKKGTEVVATGVLINVQNANTRDWYPGLQQPAMPTATLTRSLTYFGDGFSQQSVTVPGST